jgi:hypothetical protein
MTPLRSRAVFQICLVLFLISTTALAQNTIHVPADQPTIQAAINAAAPGDTVLVAPGTYDEINFNGKAITVTSSDGPAVTIIENVDSFDSVVTFNHHETLGAVLNGFTVRNGHALNGGGIEINGASPTITNNIITANYAIGGAGIHVYGGSPLIQGNTISENSRADNTDGDGGGISVSGSSTQFANPKILNNTITDNRTGGSGGGILVSYYASPLIQNNYIAGNYAYAGGGGIALTSYQTPIVLQNIIVNNTSVGEQGGGGILVGGSQPQVINNTLYGNSSADGLSGVYMTAGSGSVFSNNIVVTTSGDAITCALINNQLPGTISSNLGYSTTGQPWAGTCAAAAGVSGNLAGDPLFADPTNGDFHLQHGSRAIDTGVSDPNLPDKDRDGTTRVLDGNNDGTAVVDIGAYEFVPDPPAGLAALTPSGANFPTTSVGSSSAPVTFTLLNSGNTDLTINSISVNGAFAQNNNCPTVLTVKATCSIQVTFTPTAIGNFSGMLSVATDGANAMVKAPLSGAGATPPIVTLSPANINFGSFQIGRASSPSERVFSVTNTGGSTLTISNISVGGSPFSLGNGCPTLQPNSSCTVVVFFQPTQPGVYNDVVRISDNAPDSPQTVTLTGSGELFPITFSPASLSFSSQRVGTMSNPQTVTITNNLSSSLPIIGIWAYAPFAQTNNCPASLPAAASCTLTVTYSPVTPGFVRSSVDVQFDAPGNYDSLPISGIAVAPVASLGPDPLAFGPTLVTSTVTRVATLTNSGSDFLNIRNISVSGDDFHQQSTTCAGTLGAGSSCTITIAYSPTTRGSASGSLTVLDDAANSVSTISLTGSGTVPIASISPLSLSFGTQLVGTTSLAQLVTLSNTGDASLSIYSITATAPFAQTNNCGTSLAPGLTCTINVTFAPSSRGAVAGNLSISHSAAISGASIVALTGTGIVPPIAAVSPSSLTFGSQLVGTSSAAQTVTLSNTGDATLSIISIAAAAPFSQTSNCGSSLVAGASCVMNVSFTPSSRGATLGTLTINVGEPATTQTISLSGTGIAPPIASVSPSSLTFGSQLIGTTSAAQTITLSNTGDLVLNISSIAAAAPFAQTNNCSASLAPGASCNINVTFTPTASGSISGSLTISTNATGTATTVTLAGTGSAPAGNPTTHLDFNYLDRNGLLNAGWSFNATTAGGGTRNTEQSGTLAVSYDQAAHPGTIRIPVGSGEIWQDSNNSQNMLVLSPPTNWISIRLKIAAFNPTARDQEVGLLAYQNDDNYVSLNRIFGSNGSVVEIFREITQTPSLMTKRAITSTGNLILRIDRRNTKYTGLYSTDGGVTWTTIASVNHTLTNPKLAIQVGGDSSGTIINADLAWVEYVTP